MDIGLGQPDITLESRFADLDRPVLLTGIQALLRLLLEQRRLDQAAGLKTAALVPGSASRRFAFGTEGQFMTFSCKLVYGTFAGSDQLRFWL